MFDHSLDDLDLYNAAFVGGQWVGADFQPRQIVSNPATGARLGDVPLFGQDQANEAIESAQRAFTEWRYSSANTRYEALSNLARLVRENDTALATIIVQEAGKPHSEALGEVTNAASHFEWFAGEALRIYGDTLPSSHFDRQVIITKEPVGVTAAITPWNFPLICVARKLGPALAAGCVQVLKPAPETPFCALALAELSRRAGIPNGVFNVVTGDASEIGKAFTSHSAVRSISFTGSTRVGEIIAADAGHHVKRISLELGGNAAFIVFDDADLEDAIEDLITNKFRNAGQACVSANRVFVDERVADLFSIGLAKAVSGLKVGHGTEPGVEIGPLISEAAIEKVERHVADAVSKGGTLIAGGGRAHSNGWFYTPTVLDHATDCMLVAKEETFGPVAALFRFSSVDEVIERANATPYGLSAYVYTQDLSKAVRVSNALDAGIVGVNCSSLSSPVTPFGGVKNSGFGREGSKYGMDPFLDIKTVQIKAREF
ncbi:MAG: NAD-dependent succinate-semialdehyde dehydrogenase [Pseudomonadota bacterium]